MEMAPILGGKGGAQIARQRMRERPSRVVKGARALNLLPERNIQLFGVYESSSLCGQSAGEMHQVEAVEWAETKIRDKQIDTTVRDGGTGLSKRRYASHLGPIGNDVIEPRPEQSVRLDE